MCDALLAVSSEYPRRYGRLAKARADFLAGQPVCRTAARTLEHLTLEMLAYGRQKPAYSHFVARIFRKILAEHLTHFIRKLL
ncbi:hypothetical protein KL86DES1_22253 [uncultured Desulfovibrio sp.]|uniref:Uncharacterized protein n=1 Tax=uncultured Desulfovibrio sp. TaxID=167968 RepID=A0A212LBT8_9BACT|nr:hypothetical protein KL86DES1_22253 [uncultured Desulfovibrio sp.]VZH35147.1 conserved protein of unknown function [Desulfovibrio sp. 86]